jgi:hypothetical protein
VALTIDAEPGTHNFEEEETGGTERIYHLTLG